MSISSFAVPADSNNCDVSLIGDVNSLPLSSLTAQLDDYTNAYIAPNPVSPTNSLIVVKRSTMPLGTKATVNLMLNGKSQDGTALPETTIPGTLTTPTPPQATDIVAGSTAAHNSGSLPADPGTSPITLI